MSVLAAVYNGEEYLVEAMDSLLAQTLEDIELVVVDDASTDATSEILAGYEGRDGRFTVLRNDENLGLPAALNRGLERCRAALVARADADDVYHPERLARQAAFLGENPEVDIVGCSYHRVHPDGRRRDTQSPPRDHTTIRARQLFMNSLLHPGVMFRTDVVRSVGGYDESYWTAQDSDLWVRLRDRARFANLDDVLVEYRLHDSSIVRSRGEAGRRLSLSVPRRLLAEALGRPLTEEDAQAVVTLYQGFQPMTAEEVQRGLPLLHDVLDRTKTREPSAAVHFLRSEAAASLVKQTQHHVISDPALTRSLLASALRLDPRVVLTRRFVRRTVRSLLASA